MAQSRDRGLCRHVGVSNFSARKIEGLLTLPLAPPDVNQIELHPYLQQQSLVDFCAGHEIAVTAYSPLGSRDRNPALKPPDEPSLLDDTIIGRIASRLGATPAQVLLAWALERGTAVIPKSVSPGRLAENLAAGQLELGDQDLLAIKGLDRHRRYVSGTFWELPEGPYTVAALWDE
jgi:alcohol dehydrogenase (NADP+)